MTDDKVDALLPCPFCGEEPFDDKDEVARRVSCRTDGCAMAQMMVRPSQWNRRAPSSLGLAADPEAGKTVATTIDGLEALINNEDSRPLHIHPDGRVVLIDSATDATIGGRKDD